ncbi:hypothetical protein RHMOL_Rhmol06G0024800 [Rhododendron molle]|uniref:Uncharacterized protein n=2 Tax=Rhododendron molle TaxID=49168 RepID=A0ACC0N974_RHOML|nr:hypothetical protein RHMOL_Rhmol06G0024800 [Rhododendron molle]KAI8549442.1 hypothetical protein RHMOL_Rhmol06G0024800 [Rhododendron molle]
MGRPWDRMCGLIKLESSVKTQKRPSEGSENIEGPSCCGSACGCSPSCDCKPECHCEGFAIDPNTVTLIASVAPPVKMPSERSEKSIEA